MASNERTPDTRPSIDIPLVRRSVDRQFPQWEQLPLELFEPLATRSALSTGWPTTPTSTVGMG